MPTPPSTASSPPSWFADRRVRFGISVLVIGQLWAVIGRPLEFATQGPFGSSPSASAFYSPMRAYSQFAYLDHGYAFFAPDPGPSHFIQAAITDSEGVRIEKKYPDLSQHWPRLLYHRHFMLAEFLNDVHHPPGGPPPELAQDASASAQWVRARRRYEDVRDSILNHLRYRHPRNSVAIRRMEHRQPGLPEFLQGNIGTGDESLLRVLFDTIDDLPPRNPLPINIPTEALSAPPAEPVP